MRIIAVEEAFSMDGPTEDRFEKRRASSKTSVVSGRHR